MIPSRPNHRAHESKAAAQRGSDLQAHSGLRHWLSPYHSRSWVPRGIDGVQHHPVFGDVAEITPTGVVMSSGETVELDALACATGFDVSFHSRWKTSGRNGARFEDL
jgi:hypothetical protein